MRHARGLLAVMVSCLAACSGGDGDLRLDCVGERQLLRGNLEEPTNGVRRVKEEKQQVFELQGHKLEGQHACQVWNDKEIRCTHQKTDGSLQRQFRLDRESLRVRDQTFTKGRTLTEQITFEGECKRL